MFTAASRIALMATTPRDSQRWRMRVEPVLAAGDSRAGIAAPIAHRSGEGRALGRLWGQVRARACWMRSEPVRADSCGLARIATPVAHDLVVCVVEGPELVCIDPVFKQIFRTTDTEKWGDGWEIAEIKAIAIWF